ncbi:MAG: protein kinase [Desulfobacteraceae bacterium]|nr:protein kinase [Desulfobacteraceae bacterium]
MKTIGRYIVQGILGRGAMGKVYKVKLPVIEKIAALKLLAPNPLLVKLLGMNELRERFITEAQTMAALIHPNIVNLLDFDENKGLPYYVMDFFANNLGVMIGETYRTEKPSRIIDLDKALDYMRQTLKGIGCLHAAGVIHRDIKPYNLLVTSWDEVKICDFGLSRLRGEVHRGPDNLKVGSAYYTAPEQEDNPDKAKANADLYSVGIIFYRMITGRLPETELSGEPYSPPSRLNTDLDAPWDQFIAKAIASDQKNRYPDAHTMLSDLDRLKQHWQNQKQKICSMHESQYTAKENYDICPLRSKPVKIPPSKAPELFKTDHLWRPKTYVTNQFSADTQNIVKDNATGLIWQQSGSSFPDSFQKANMYIKKLNHLSFEGLNHWRLPTINELMSLLRPAQGLELCIEPVFNNLQRWLWSSDRRSFTIAYYVDIELGFVAWQDFSAPFYVRAVCPV